MAGALGHGADRLLAQTGWSRLRLRKAGRTRHGGLFRAGRFCVGEDGRVALVCDYHFAFVQVEPFVRLAFGEDWPVGVGVED